MMKVKELRISPISHRNSLNPTSEITSQRANKIYNEVKNMILK